MMAIKAIKIIILQISPFNYIFFSSFVKEKRVRIPTETKYIADTILEQN